MRKGGDRVVRAIPPSPAPATALRGEGRLDTGLSASGQVARVSTAFAILFAYAFVSNVAVAALPHEPVVIWYGAHAGVWATALVATAGTVAASWVDHRIFGRVIAGITERARPEPRPVRGPLSLFRRAPFAVLTLSGMTPLPFFPFKAMAFAARYPLRRYLAAVAMGRLPRYALLAWLGQALTMPLWLFILLFLALLTPSLRVLPWPRRDAT